MAVITLKISHLCIFALLILHVNSHVIDSIPLCGRIDGSSAPKESDQIYFKDQGIRTVEINGTFFPCYPDQTTVDPTSVEPIDGARLHSRIREDEQDRTDPIPSARFIPNVSRCARRNQTYCTQDSTYPADHIEKLLRKYAYKYADVFGSDSLANDVGPRIDAIDEVKLCQTFEQVIYPTSGTRQDGTEAFIFNTQQHPQGVRVSICQNAGKPCALSEIFPNNHRTECKQQYVFRELLSLSPEGRPVKEKFEFPACCSCAVYKV